MSVHSFVSLKSFRLSLLSDTFHAIIFWKLVSCSYSDFKLEFINQCTWYKPQERRSGLKFSGSSQIVVTGVEHWRAQWVLGVPALYNELIDTQE